MFQGRTLWLSGVDVPQPRCPVVTPGQCGAAVGAEGHGGGPGPRDSGAVLFAGRCRRPTAAPFCRRLPVNTVRPSGLNATAWTGPSCFRGGPLLSGGDVPQPRCPVVTPGQYGAAVGAEGHGPDGAIVFQGRSLLLAGSDVPQPRRLVFTAGQRGAAVGAERRGGDPARVVFQGRTLAGRWRRPTAAPSSLHYCRSARCGRRG